MDAKLNKPIIFFVGLNLKQLSTPFPPNCNISKTFFLEPLDLKVYYGWDTFTPVIAITLNQQLQVTGFI